MKIGVFDSGIGGQAVAQRLEFLLPAAEIISINDRDNMPYGSKSPSEILDLALRAIRPLIDMKCDVIVIACNTVTTVAIAKIRQAHPDVHFIGIEPMVKPAATMTKTGKITVMATPATLASSRYKDLKTLYARGIEVVEPDCTTWASLIEDGFDGSVPIEKYVDDAIQTGSDVIVLGCTHYHWLKDRAVNAAKNQATILEPSDAIASRIKELLRLQ